MSSSPTPPNPLKPKILATGIAPRDLANALGRHWLLVFVVAPLLALAASTVVWFGVVIPKQMATVVFHISSREKAVLQPTPESQVDFFRYREAQSNLVKSRLVLKEVLERKEVQALPVIRNHNDPFEWLEDQIAVDFRNGPEFMRVTIEGDEDYVGVLLEGVTETYLKQIVKKDKNNRVSRLEQLRTVYNQYEDSLRKKRQAVRQVTVEMGSGDEKVIALKQQFAQEQLHASQRDLLNIRSELRKLQLEDSALSSRDPAGEIKIPDALIDDELDRDPLIRQRRDTIVKMELRLEEAKRVVTPGANPTSISSLQGDIQSAKTALDAELVKSRPAAIKSLGERLKRSQDAEARAVKKRLEMSQAHEKVLTADIEQFMETARKLSSGRVDVESFNREIAQTEKMTEQLSGSIEALKVEIDAPDRVAIHEPVVVTGVNRTKTRMKYAAYLSLAIMGLTSLGVIAWEGRRRRVLNPDDVSLGLGLRLMGTVPEVNLSKKAPWDPSKGVDPHKLLGEAIDSTRTMFLHASQREGIKILLITSPLSGEAKTSLSCHLSLSLGRAGVKTLLIDADIRRPAAHRVLGLNHDPGLAEVLRGEKDWKDVIVPTSEETLMFFPSGRWSSTIPAVLSGPNWGKLMAELRDEYEIIVVDTSPILPVADTMQLVKHVDGVILSVLRNVTQLGPLHEAQQFLARLGAYMVGAVVSGVRSEHYHYRYFYQYVSGPAIQAADDESRKPRQGMSTGS